MESKNTKKDLYLQKRDTLNKLSREAERFRALKIKEAKTKNEAFFWASKTINYILLNYIYETVGATEFNTFKQWKEKNATVKKGEKAYAIWGQPLNEQKNQIIQEISSDKILDKYKYFPICYLFSNLQVTTNDCRAEKQETEVNSQNKNIESLVI